MMTSVTDGLWVLTIGQLGIVGSWRNLDCSPSACSERLQPINFRSLQGCNFPQYDRADYGRQCCGVDSEFRPIAMDMTACGALLGRAEALQTEAAQQRRQTKMGSAFSPQSAIKA